MTDLPAFEQARDQLIEDYRATMVGPGKVDELLVDSPTRTYVCGFLSPTGAEIENDQNDEFQTGGDNASLEGIPSLINAMWPSAMGMTFHVRRDVKKIRVKITGSFYKLVSVKKEPDPAAQKSEEKKARGGPFKEEEPKAEGNGSKPSEESSPSDEVERWRRIPFEESYLLEMEGGSPKPVSLQGGIELDVRKHDYKGDLPRLATLSLINRNKFSKEEWQERDERTFFQPVLEVTAEEGENPDCFVEAPAVGTYREDSDLAQHLLLYRNKCDFATGHGCAAEWEVSEAIRKTARLIRSRFIPAAEVLGLHYDIFRTEDDSLAEKMVQAVQPACEPGDDPNAIFAMRHLGGGRDDAWIIAALNSFCEVYKIWLKQRASEIDVAISEVQDSGIRDFVRSEAAELNIHKAGPEILERMRAGIKELESNEVVFRSFRLANEAMHRQLKMATLQKKARDGEAPGSIDELPLPGWRPFQLAFLLLTINSICNPDLRLPDCEISERELMDLIWFPTGGGKTEAYLGLTAFTLFYRRLSRENPDEGGGVSVFTRYTLRLLTTQQFERATRLICACEDLRTKKHDVRGESLNLGSTKFSIGLWIGGESSPNRFKDIGDPKNPVAGAVSIVKKLKEDRGDIGTQGDAQADVRQIRVCPWCGNEIDKRDIDVFDEHGKKITSSARVDGDGKYRLVMRCRGALPAPLDGPCPFSGEEGIPAKIVDDEIYDDPPSVIIGTVDKFVRLAWKSDTRSLFGRFPDGARLPPPDLIIQDELHLISGPLGTMVGLFESAVDLIARDDQGRSPKIVGSTATIRRAEDQVRGLFNREVRQFPAPELTAGDSFFSRVDKDKPGRKYLGIMAPGSSGKSLWLRTCGALMQLANELDEEKRNPYWTLISYFNSLRELAGGNVLAQDSVLAYMKTFSQIRQNMGGQDELREIGLPIELTSRVKAKEIPAILKDLQEPYEGPRGGTAIDLLLATNMISVGVDVDRLGLMVILGQPKTTAEYIQASSRVGRQWPGLVLTLSNWTRSRDRSHYERFVPYHEAFYREVEPTSVTPWSGPSRDRMLSGVLITVLRQLEDELAETPDALERIPEEDLLKRLLPIIERAEELDPLEAATAREEIENRINRWKRWAGQPGNVVYGTGMHFDVGPNHMMRQPTAPNGVQDGLEAVPHTMRTVEPVTGYRLWRVSRKT